MQEIKSIIEEYENINLNQEKVALAVVVNVEESSYRRIGARMLVRSNGQWVGGISGGCLEGDALKRSLHAIHQNKSSKVVYDTLEEDENQIGVGLGCNGKIEVVFTPIDLADLQNEIHILKKIVDTDRDIVLLRVIESEDPHTLGKLVLEDHLQANAFDGIDIVALKSIIEKVKAAGRSYIQNFLLDNGSNIRILFELIRPEIKLLIIGDNYDVTAMVGLANQLAWKIIIAGDIRKLSKEIVANVFKVFPYTEIKNISIDQHTAVVLLSHDYSTDKAALPILLTRKPRYLGMLGPKKRLHKMEDSLGNYNFSKIGFFYSPVGFDIGAETPSEIALSILTEILAVFRDKKGMHLRNKQGSIHERK